MATMRPAPTRPYTVIGTYEPRRPRGRARRYKFRPIPPPLPPEDLV